jgi:SAM-dependent methyltransferase
MLDFTTYDFGYPFYVTNAPLVPLALFGGLTALAAWLQWPRWVTVISGALAVWALAALVLTHAMFRLHAPQELPTDKFLSSGRGHVLDAGAGSGRSAIGVLTSRPQATVTALDIYDGFYGIVDNTPDRFLANARAGGFESRVDARTGDVRDMPFDAGTFDGVVSSFAIDHLPRKTIPTAISEVARVLKARGEFLLMIINVDVWTLLVSPHALHHHPPADAARWREMLDEGGFTVAEEGTRPAMRYFYATKRAGAPPDS